MAEVVTRIKHGILFLSVGIIVVSGIWLLVKKISGRKKS
jgi:hypothetical protein